MRLRNLLILSLLGMPGQAFALEMEYHTYNGFLPIKTAFETIALIFSDGNYVTLFAVACALGAIAAVASAVVQIAKLGKANPMSVVWPLLIGAVLYSGFIVPKGDLHIYDDTLNRYQKVSGIPNGIVLIAGFLNQVEYAITEIVSTAGTPDTYSNSAGGIGFNALYKATAGPIALSDTYLDNTVRRYTVDCVYFGIQNGNIDANAVSNTSTDFTVEWQAAANPAVYTTVYTAAAPGGFGASCSEAWSSYIKPALNSAAMFAGPTRTACANAGFNTSNVSELTKCKQLIGDYVNVVSNNGVAMDATQFMRQSYMAEVLYNLVQGGDTDKAMTATANRNTVTSMIGTGMMANEWIPVIRAVVTAVAIGLVPIVFLFIPTPLVGAAFKTVLGLFVWLTCWAVTDSMVHQLAVKMAASQFDFISEHGLGFTSMMLFPNAGMKAMALFGSIRSAGIMLATIVSYEVMKFGGHALASFAGNFQGQVQAAGSQAAQATATAEGISSSLGQHKSAGATMMMASKYDWRSQVHGQANQMSESHGSSTEYGVGGHGMDNAFSAGAGRTAKMLTEARGAAAGIGRPGDIRAGVAAQANARFTTDTGEVVSQTFAGPGSTAGQKEADSGVLLTAQGNAYRRKESTNTATGVSTRLLDGQHGNALLDSRGGVVSADLKNVKLSGRKGDKTAQTEVFATEMAQKMDKEQLYSNTDGYLKSLGWGEKEIKALKNSYRSQTGFDITENTAHRQSNTEAKGVTTSAGARATAGARGSASVSAEMGTPSFLPASAKTKISAETYMGVEGHVGVEASKSKTQQNSVDKAVIGTASESSTASHDREISKAIEKAVQETKDTRFAQSTAEKLGLSETSKSAIRDTREAFVGADMSVELPRFMLNNLMSNDGRFKSRGEEGMVDAIAFLDGDTAESRAYIDKMREQYINEYGQARDVNARIDNAGQVFGTPDKHLKGPDVEKKEQLEAATTDLQGIVDGAVAGAPGIGSHAGIPKPVDAPNHRPAKSVPKTDNPPPEDAVARKVRQLNVQNNATISDQTVLPRISTNVQDPRTTATKVNVFGSETFGGRGKPTGVPAVDAGKSRRGVMG